MRQETQNNLKETFHTKANLFVVLGLKSASGYQNLLLVINILHIIEKNHSENI